MGKAAQKFGLPLDTAPDGGAIGRGAAGRRGQVAVRAEMGRLPLPRLQGGRGGGAPREIRQALGRFFPEVVALLRALAVRAVRRRRRARHRDRWPPRLRRAADAASSGGEPHPKACRQRRRRGSSCSTSWLGARWNPVWSIGRSAERRRALEAFRRKASGRGAACLSRHATRQLAEGMALARRLRRRRDGVVAKRLDRPYEAGERAMIKVKRLRTADCVVGGFRYESRGRRVGSLCSASTTRKAARPCRLHLDHRRARAPGSDADARGAARARPASPARPRAARAAGAPSGAGNGSRFGRSWSSKCATTMSPAAASAMAPSSCAGARTRRRGNARWTRSRRRPWGL